MKPFTTGRVYVNFIGDEGEDRVVAAFGGRATRACRRSRTATTPTTCSAAARTSGRAAGSDHQEILALVGAAAVPALGEVEEATVERGLVGRARVRGDRRAEVALVVAHRSAGRSKWSTTRLARSQRSDSTCAPSSSRTCSSLPQAYGWRAVGQRRVRREHAEEAAHHALGRPVDQADGAADRQTRATRPPWRMIGREHRAEPREHGVEAPVGERQRLRVGHDPLDRGPVRRTPAGLDQRRARDRTRPPAHPPRRRGSPRCPSPPRRRGPAPRVRCRRRSRARTRGPHHVARHGRIVAKCPDRRRLHGGDDRTVAGAIKFGS